jgi:Ca2+-binding EF-hand superfamily protein
MLTDLQRRKLTRYFRMYDMDDDGEIKARDFERIIENVRILHGLPSGSSAHAELRAGYMRRWEALRSSADADHDGGVDLGEWLTYFQSVLGHEERYEAEIVSVIRRLLGSFDLDEDGTLGPDEFCNFHGLYGQSAEVARQVFAGLDHDGDGLISHSELVDLAHEFFLGDNLEAPANHFYGPLGD